MEIFVLIVTLLVLVFLLSWFRRLPSIPVESFLSLPTIKPNLYWFVDSQPNSRNWWDFTSRKSDTPNRGYLQVSLEQLHKTQGEHFNIIPLIGRLQTMVYLEDAHPRAVDLPPSLWRNYVIAYLCAKKGGLAMDGNSVLCTGGSFLPFIENQYATLFGSDHNEVVVSQNAITPGPDNYIGWSVSIGHPAWLATLSDYTKLIKSGQQSWSSAIARRMPSAMWQIQKKAGMKCIREIDGSRLPDGRLRQLEDYFGRTGDIEDPKQKLPENCVYVTYDGEELERRFEFNWFLRLNKRQLEESRLLWCKYAGLF